MKTSNSPKSKKNKGKMASESVPWCLQNVVGGKVERRFVWDPRNGELWCGQAFPLERGSFWRLVGNATSIPQRVNHQRIQERQELVNFNGFWRLSCPDLKIWEIAIPAYKADFKFSKYIFAAAYFRQFLGTSIDSGTQGSYSPAVVFAFQFWASVDEILTNFDFAIGTCLCYQYQRAEACVQ